MHKHTFPACLLLLTLLGPPGLAQGGFGTFQLGDNSAVTVTGISDTNNISWTQYLEVAQFSPVVSLRLAAGEINVRTPTGETSDIGWDHPLTHSWKSDFVPVYQYNSAAFANPAVTHPFTLRAGDTLALFRDFGFRFPVRNEDGTERSFEQDTAGFVLPDSIVFSIDLIDAKSGGLVRTMERFVVPPCNGWSAFFSVLATTMQPRLLRDSRYPYMVTFVADPEFDDALLRLRINPQYLSRLPGSYSERAMYMRFTLNPRLSGMVDETWDRDMDEARSIFAKIVDQLALPKEGSGDPASLPQNPDMVIYPSLISRLAPDLHVWVAKASGGESVALYVADITGRMLYQEERRSQGEQDMLFRLPAHATQGGLALVVARVNGSVSHSLVRFY